MDNTSICKKEPCGSFLPEMSMKLIVVFVARGLSAAVSRPVGLLKAGASGVATSVGVASCFFAFASNTIVVAISVDKFAASADHHKSLTMVNIVDAGLEGVVA